MARGKQCILWFANPVLYSSVQELQPLPKYNKNQNQ